MLDLIAVISSVQFLLIFSLSDVLILFLTVCVFLIFRLGKPVVLPFSLKVYSHRSRSSAMHMIQMHLDILGIIPSMSFSAVNVIFLSILQKIFLFF